MPKTSSLKGIHDSPKKIANAAVREARAAEGDLDIRQAAEKGWLAACAAVDVASVALCLPAPQGKDARVRVLHTLERKARLKRNSLIAEFAFVWSVAHGACFYEGRCQTQEVVEAWMERVRDFVADVDDAVRVAARRR